MKVTLEMLVCQSCFPSALFSTLDLQTTSPHLNESICTVRQSQISHVTFGHVFAAPQIVVVIVKI